MGTSYKRNRFIMINAQEIRIGNLLHNDGVVVTIDARSIFDIWDDKGLKNYKPIQLTEHWLEKFNFYNEGYEFSYSLDLDKTLKIVITNGVFYPILIQEPEFSSMESQVIGLKSIEFVHDLQNLVFTLKKEELTIK